MKINVEEINTLIKKEIEGYKAVLSEEEVGTVLDVGDGIAKIHGLNNIMAGEMVEFEDGTTGLALNLEENSVGTVILGNYLHLKEGVSVKRLKRLLSVPVGAELIGQGS